MSFDKSTLLKVPYALVDYALATEIIIQKAINKTSYSVSALAVHGLIEFTRNESLNRFLPNIDMIVPDGKPIQWALNAVNNAALSDRVSGPDLTIHVLRAANKERLRIYLFGSTSVTLNKLISHISNEYPNIIVCGSHIDRFREATIDEDTADIEKINESGANIVLVGRGCPRQEIWVSTHTGQVNAVMLAVGAAFDFLVGNIKRPPIWVQTIGLEWLYRLSQEPRRLFKRYAVTNSLYLFYVSKAFIKKNLNDN